MAAIQVRANTIFTAEQFDGRTFPTVLTNFDCPYHIITVPDGSTLWVDNKPVGSGDWIVFIQGEEDFNVLSNEDFRESYMRVVP